MWKVCKVMNKDKQSLMIWQLKKQKGKNLLRFVKEIQIESCTKGLKIIFKINAK